jgi:hypothetical protein
MEESMDAWPSDRGYVVVGGQVRHRNDASPAGGRARKNGDVAKVAELRKQAGKQLGWRFRYIPTSSLPRWGIVDAEGNQVVRSANADEVEHIVMAAIRRRA